LPYASRIRVVRLREAAKDVSEWFERGHTEEELKDLATNQAEEVWARKAAGRLPAGVEVEEESVSLPVSYDLSDVGNAARFRDRFLGKVRWSPSLGWLVWNGINWEVDETLMVYRLAIEVTELIEAEALSLSDPKASERLQKFAIATRSSSRLEAMLNVARAMEGIHVRPMDLDFDPYLLNCLNGVLDLRTGKLLPHDPEMLLSQVTGTSFNPEAECPEFEKFLAEILPDLDTRRYLIRCLGYGLTGSTDEQVMFLLYGSGANGKSTLVNVMFQILGSYADKLSTSALLINRFDQSASATPELAKLVGKRFVAASEIEEGQRLSEVRVKELTGGEPITARRLYREEFTFRPKFKLFFSANHKPIVHGQETAIWRRIRLLPFTVSIPPHQQDKRLAEKLVAESDGILAKLVKGASEWLALGSLDEPDEVINASEEYRNEMDIVGKFIKECFIETPSGNVKNDQLYRIYAEWCKSNGERQLSHTRLSRILKSDKGFLQYRGSGFKYWRGLQVRSRYPGKVDESDEFDEIIM